MKYNAIVFFILIALHSQGQIVSKTEISWNETNRLTLDDFKKIKGKNQSVFVALTYAYINYNIIKTDTAIQKEKITKTEHGTVKIVSTIEPEKKCVLNIQAVFSKTASWVDIEFLNDKTLKHEQKHFDIVEIMARMFRKEAIEKLKKGKCNIDLKDLKSKYTVSFNKLNRKYDKQTNHSINKVAQKKWEEEIIPKMLEELKEYSSPNIIISNCGCIH